MIDSNLSQELIVMKTILIISYSPLHRDPRIQRQIHALKGSYNLQAIGYTSPDVSGVDFFELVPQPPNTDLLIKVRRGLQFLFHEYDGFLDRVCSISSIRACAENPSFKIPDVIFANDWNGLYAAVRLSQEKGWNNSRIYFDAHEWWPDYKNYSLFWKVISRPQMHYALRQAKNQVAVMSTVCPTLARMYEDWFGFERGFVRVITNSPDYEPDLEPQPVGEKIRLIHHGGAMPERQLEKMIDMMACLPADRYELTFMLVKSDAAYYDELQRRAGRFPNIRFIEPVPFAEIPKLTNQFDIGLFILNNTIINYRYALPNKFFEFVQARLAIAVGDSPEMRDYIEKYQLGVSARKNTAKAMADEILKLSKDDIMGFKRNAQAYARELSSEPNVTSLRKIADELAGK